MPGSSSIWRRGFVEFLAIFAGVTLSFLAEDWRQALQDHKDEERVLTGVASDLEEDLSFIRGKIQTDSLGLVGELWLQANWDRSSPPTDSVQAALEDFFHGATYSPMRSEYESAKSAGRLQLIQDDDLRSAIITYYERGQPQQQVVNRMQLDLHFEVWRQLRPYLQFGRDFAESAGTTPKIGLFRPWPDVRADQVLRNSLVEAMSMRRINLAQMRGHASATEQLHDELAERLAR